MTAKKKSVPRFSHLDSKGKARMVDVSAKPETAREAVAVGQVVMKRETLQAIAHGKVPKGDVLAVARVAGIMGGKNAAATIPMCHPLKLDQAEVGFAFGTKALYIRARCKSRGSTGVEMEALVSAASAALAIYDMCKSADRGMELGPFALARKSGGKSGLYVRPGKLDGPSFEDDEAWG